MIPLALGVQSGGCARAPALALDRLVQLAGDANRILPILRLE
jgi:hypothetical protein